MKRFDPLSLVQPSGIQPYEQAGGQLPGPALLAMLRGATFSGFNPMDAKRGAQAVSGDYPRTVLASLMSNTSPPGGGGSWQLTPDQFDRNGDWSRRQWAEREARRRRPRFPSGPPRNV